MSEAARFLTKCALANLDVNISTEMKTKMTFYFIKLTANGLPTSSHKVDFDLSDVAELDDCCVYNKAFDMACRKLKVGSYE